MYPIMINTWYCCSIDGNVELCKICRIQPVTEVRWQIVTYYDGKNVFAGTLKECITWIDVHITNEKRYLNREAD